MATPPKADKMLWRRIGRRLRALRLARGLTQEGLAKKYRLPVKTVKRLEQGRGDVWVSELRIWAQRFGTTMEDLIKPRKGRRAKPGRPKKRPKKQQAKQPTKQQKKQKKKKKP
jgi:transcriptional regulator with XRE-family HTH domain